MRKEKEEEKEQEKDMRMTKEEKGAAADAAEKVEEGRTRMRVSFLLAPCVRRRTTT